MIEDDCYERNCICKINYDSYFNEGKGINKLNNVMNVSCCLLNKFNL